MEPLTITIQPPITEHCSECDYEAARSFFSTLCTCPSCGKDSIRNGPRSPEKQCLRAIRCKGNYNLMAPSEQQYQYCFIYGVPDGKQYSFVVNEKLETDDPVALAIELKEIIDGYLINSDKPKIEKLVSMVGTDEFIEEYEALKNEERRLKLERELFKLNKRTGCYK